MDLDGLTPEQQQVYWEVKEWFPHSARAALIAHIDQGLDTLICLCEDGTIPQDEYDLEDLKREEKREAAELERVLRASANQQPLYPQPLLHEQQVVRVMHVGSATAGIAAGTAAPQLMQQHRTFEEAVAAAAASKPAPAAAAAPAPAAPPPAPIEPKCAVCRKTRYPTARCHRPINKADGDKTEEDPRAHPCCANCITQRYMFKRIMVTSRVAISCLKSDCNREIHQDRLITDAGIKPALARWMLGFTDVTVGDARRDHTVQELRRKREEEPEISQEERERLIVIIDHMDHDKFTYLADMLPGVDFTWLLENIDRGTVETILDWKEHDSTVPKRKRRRLDKKGITHLLEDRLRLQTTFECCTCWEEFATVLGVPCVKTGGGEGVDPTEQHLFCGACVRGHAAAATEEQASIVRAGLGLRCMAPGCTGVLIYAHVEPLLEAGTRERLEEKIAAEALAAAAVNVERCQRCPFAAIVDLAEQQTFACRRCGFEYCRNCNREWSARHEGKTCEELNPEFIRRKVENALSDGAVGVLQRCPSCNVAFEKNGGCNNMHCKCGYSFPYAGVKVMSAEQRAAILQQAVAEAAGDASVVEELNKIK